MKQKGIMANSTLVIELVFSNAESFQNLSIKQVKNILLTCKLANTNENIVKSANKYKTWGMLSRVLRVLENAVEELISSDDSKEAIRAYKELFAEAQYMINDISDICEKNEGLRQCLSAMIIAVHKEKLYKQMHYKATNVDIQLHTFYEHYFIEGLGICENMFVDMHNPHYDIFTNQTYEFCTMEKNKKKSMVQIYKEWRKSLYDKSDDD
jgi:hypothetical protein